MPSTSPVLRSRPTGPSYLNRLTRQSLGLVACVVMVPAGGAYRRGIRDLVSGTDRGLDFANAGTGVAGATADGGRGLVLNATSAGANATPDADLKPGFPITIDAWVTPLGTPTANAGIFGLYDNASNGSPFVDCVLDFDGSSRYDLSFNTNGTFHSVSSNKAVTVGKLTHVCGVLINGLHTIYVDGVAMGSESSAGDIVYGASTPLFAIGNQTGVTRNPALIFHVGRIWKRAFTPGEVWTLRAPQTRWEMFRRPERVRTYAFPVAAPPPAPPSFNALLLAGD